jgi:orotate phosphoribosyltransferase
MNQYQQDFIEFAISKDVLQFGEFKLKSGRLSPYFFNTGLFNDGESLQRLGEYYSASIIDSGVSFDMLYGPAYKGIPLVSTLAISLNLHHGRSVPFCFNRKEEKDHGEGGVILGAPLKNKVLIIDDVITAGTSINESMQLIQNANATASGVVIAVDRQERGTGEFSAIQEVEKRHNIPVISIINLDLLIEYIENNDQFSRYLNDIRKYRENYGIN